MSRRRIFALGLALVLGSGLAACGGGTDGATADKPRELVWSDEFDGAAGTPPDPTKWGYMTGGKGWGNQELQCYTDVPGNVAADGAGHLVITAIQQPGHVCVDGATNDYTSARLTSQGKFTEQYGRLEMRAQVPDGVGTWAAFWALGEDHDTVGWPASGEIDVMEHVGQKPAEVLGTVHGPKADGSRWYLTGREDTGTGLGDGFHTYAVEWSKDRFTWYLDGKEYHSVTRADAEKQGRWVYDKPFYLLLNLAVGGGLGGPVPAETTWPQKYVVDYVRVYR